MTNEEKAEIEARMRLESKNGEIPRSEMENKKSVDLQSLLTIRSHKFPQSRHKGEKGSPA